MKSISTGTMLLISAVNVVVCFVNMVLLISPVREQYAPFGVWVSVVSLAISVWGIFRSNKTIF